MPTVPPAMLAQVPPAMVAPMPAPAPQAGLFDPTPLQAQQPKPPIPTVERMRKAIKKSDSRWEWVRANRRRNVKIFAGPYYGPDNQSNDPYAKGAKRSMVSLMLQAVENYHAQLCPNSVRNDFTAKRMSLEHEAMMVSAAVDHVWNAEKLCRQVVSPIVMDALTAGLGIAVTGIKAGSDVCDVEGVDYPTGQVFTEYVDIDDYIIDASARRWSERLFEGHRYRVPVEYAKTSPLFAGREGLLESLPKVRDSKGEKKQDRVDDLSRQHDSDDDAIVEQIELIDLTLYLDGGAWEVTIPASRPRGQEGENEEPLLVRPYEGPPGGRYRYLMLMDVVGNVVPQALATTILDKHVAADRLGEKMTRQMLRTKKMLVYERDASEDALAITTGGDGQAIAVDDIDRIKEVEFGGVIDDFYKGVEWIMAMFNNDAGQVQMLGGTGQLGQDGTATEATILQNNAMQRLNKYRERVELFCTDVSEAIAFWLITDPLLTLPVTIRGQGGEAFDLVYTAETREGGFLDFNFRCRCSRGQSMSPEVKSARMMQLVTEVAPAALELHQVGAARFSAIMRAFCDTLDMSEFETVFNDPDLVMAREQMLAPTANGMQPGQPTAPGGMPQGGNSTIGAQRSAMQQGQPQAPSRRV